MKVPRARLCSSPISISIRRIFTKKIENKLAWAKEAKQFAARIISSVVALDKALHSSGEVTPEPQWAADPAFELAVEDGLRSELLDAERQVEEAQKRKEDVQALLKAAGRMRALLYEKGRPLESAIIDALRLFGFSAKQYKQGDSEFDVVFESAEGRLLGEAEGKDSKAINVDKLRQLTMNIQEDLQREEVNAPAKGVLFGNGYRLSPPREREVQFTEKCVTASRSFSTARLATSEMYRAAQYLSNHPEDDAYAKACREAFWLAKGSRRCPLLRPQNLNAMRSPQPRSKKPPSKTDSDGLANSVSQPPNSGDATEFFCQISISPSFPVARP